MHNWNGISKAAVVTATIAALAYSLARADGAIVLGSAVNTLASAQVSPNPTLNDPQSASQTMTLNPLSATSDAFTVSGNQSIDATATVSASWINSDSGLVNFQNIGWQTANVASSAAIGINASFEYDFTATTSGLLTVDYDLTAHGTSFFGLIGMEIKLVGGAGGTTDIAVPLIGTPPFHTAGSTSFNTVAGTTYTLSIAARNPNISGPNIQTRTSLMDADFTWTLPAPLEPVPEPASIAVWSFFAAAGLGLKRLRK